jgi:hypothetical protein
VSVSLPLVAPATVAAIPLQSALALAGTISRAANRNAVRRRGRLSMGLKLRRRAHQTLIGAPGWPLVLGGQALGL